MIQFALDEPSQGKMMIEVVTPFLKASYAEELETIFRIRHRVFKERLGWDVPSSDGLEQDQYDHEDAWYLLLRDDDDKIVGTCRLIPTTSSYMIGEVFADLLDGDEPPHSPKVWEVSRLAMDSTVPGRRMLSQVHQLTSQLYCGLVELGLSLGITELIGVYDRAVARFMSRAGAKPSWQGQAHIVGGTSAMAVRFDVTEQALFDIRRAGGIVESVIKASPWSDERTAA
jgi:acyl homoserine lactone synthase